MSAQQECPYCGHLNLDRAVVCFQCGKPLRESSADEEPSPTTRRSQRIYEAMQPEGQPVTRGRRPDTNMLRDMGTEEPVTCLNCGALNRPTANHCQHCGAELIVPDDEDQLILRASARSDVGQLRENNEDSIGLWAFKGMLLALVADGMGGAVAGEEASRLTVEAVQADFVGGDRAGIELLTQAEEMISEKLAAALQAANLAVIDRVDENAALRGMGTTATLAFVRGRRALLAHVGDSRAYLIDGEEKWITQVTSDHSFVEALVMAGHITPEQAIDHPMRNVLYRALGQTPDTTADLYNRYLKLGDRIVICSDGLTRHVTPDEIAQLVLKDDNPEAATQRLIDLANRRGGEDNISAVVIMVDRDGEAATPAASTDEHLLETRDNPAIDADLAETGKVAPEGGEQSTSPKAALASQDFEAEIAADFFNKADSDSPVGADTLESAPNPDLRTIYIDD
jgi:serine/threonine protein phosphatase PrpC